MTSRTPHLPTNDALFRHLATELARADAYTPERIWLRATLDALVENRPGPRPLESLRLLAEQSDARPEGHNRVRITAPDASLTDDEVLVVQFLLGYAPAGYGFPANLVARPDGSGVSWTCSASCD